MKRLKRIAAIVLITALLLCTTPFSVEASAASAGDYIKGQTVCEALKMDGAAYMNWLLSHEHDDYYLGTPYRAYDHRNPNGDCKGANGYLDIAGQPGMNCMGFVWHVLRKATEFSGGDVDRADLSMLRLTFYRGLNITRRYFPNKQAMLDSGHLEKGDIIWMILDQDEDYGSEYNHTGIYWGDGHSDVLWHSNTVTGGQGKCNVISKIYPMKDRNTMYIVLKVGAVTLSKPKLKSAVNTEKGIKITWDKVKGASNYRVFLKTPGKWKKLGDTTGTSYTYTGAAEGEECVFTVRCITACGKGFTSMYDSKGISCQRITALPTPTIPAPQPTQIETSPPTEAETNAAPRSFILGDVDSDAEVTILDATTIQLRMADLPTTTYDPEAADVDRDGETTVFDATVIQHWLAGLLMNEDIGTEFSSS